MKDTFNIILNVTISKHLRYHSILKKFRLVSHTRTSIDAGASGGKEPRVGVGRECQR